MPITEISRDWGVSPSIVRLTTTDSFAVITAGNYLAEQSDVIESINKGVFEWVLGDVIAITYSNGQAFFTRDENGNLVVDIDIPAGSITTAMIQDGAVTYPKIQNVNPNNVLGRANDGVGIVEEIPCTAVGRAVIGAANQAAGQTALGLGSISTQNANAVNITGGTLGGAVTGVTQPANTNNTTLATTQYADSIAAAGAPVGATYITQIPNGTLTNEQALSALATGIMKSTTATGIVSIAAAGTDYVAPSTTLTIAGTANEVTSSAGAQDLSTNRTWTLSLPSALTFTGKTITGGAYASASATLFTFTTGSIGTAVTAVTQAPNTNNTTIATTAYADAIGAAGAPVSATYITQTPNATLSNEQALSNLSTGILKSTTGTGVISIAASNTDYLPVDGGTATNFTHTTGSLGTAVTAVTQTPGTNNTTVSTTAYADAIGAAGAPVGATYITQTANATLTNEQALGSLATGIMKSTTGTGIVSIAAAGTDYVAPSTTITIAGTANEITSSAGAQDLSTNRTWTLSLPASLTFTGKTITGGSYDSASATNFTFTTGSIGTAVTAVTQAVTDSSTKIATTAFVSFFAQPGKIYPLMINQFSS